VKLRFGLVKKLKASTVFVGIQRVEVACRFFFSFLPNWMDFVLKVSVGRKGSPYSRFPFILGPLGPHTTFARPRRAVE